MDEKESRSDRARYHENTRDVYHALHGTDAEQAPFLMNKDVFMFAAVLGFRRGTRKSLEAGRKEGIRMEVFSDKDRDILKAIALADANNIRILEKKPNEIISSEVLSIAEEYANAGIEELRTLISITGFSLWNIVDIIL